MPSQDEAARTRPPLTPREKEALEQQDRETLESDLWGWYPFLYRDADTVASGADPGITPWQPPSWTLNFPDITLPEEPEQQTGNNPAPTDRNYPTWPELVDAISDNLPSGSGMDLPIPPCVAADLGGPVKSGDSGLFSPTRLTQLLGRESAPGTVDLKFGEGACANYTGFRIKWACYPDGSAWGVPLCKDGIDVFLVDASGTETSLLSPRPQAYTGGTNPSGWATMTAAEIINYAWNQYLTMIRSDCGCE